MWRRETVGRELVVATLTTLLPFPDVLLEPRPLRLLGVLVLLPWIAVLTTWAPIVIARPWLCRTLPALAFRAIALALGAIGAPALGITIRARSFPPALAASKTGVARGVA